MDSEPTHAIMVNRAQALLLQELLAKAAVPAAAAKNMAPLWESVEGAVAALQKNGP
jgi:hypothetical protein